MTPIGGPYLGDVVLRQAADYGIKIIEAPPLARMSLELLRSSSPAVTVDADRITLAGQVVYRIVGWDSSVAALVLELVEDHRPKEAKP